MNYNEKLKALRKHTNVTQAKIAEALNINRTTYTNYELGKTEPSIKSLIALAHMLDTTVDDIVCFEDNHIDWESTAETDSLAGVAAQERDRYYRKHGLFCISDLYDDEQILVMKYRTLSPEQKALMIDLIEKEQKKVLDEQK